jgi:hypothetical protein
MIKKDFRCDECGDFISGIAICPQCGAVARRVFNSAPSFSRGSAKSIDRVIAGEFARRNISNYTNVTGSPRVNYGSGSYNGIEAGWGKQHLATVQQQYAPMMSPRVSLQAPALPPGHNEIPPDRATDGRNAQPWSQSVPTERMDLTPNE